VAVAAAADDDLADFRPTLVKWLENDVRPYVLEFEHADRYPVDMVEQMREFGLFGATIPREYGGLGLAARPYAEIVATISGVWMSLTGGLNSHLMMAHLTNRFGTQEQRDAFLPLLASGQLRGGLALTEPDCGTDLQAIRTLARREGDGYLVTGNKTWITNGGQGNALALLVKTDLEAKPRHTGMSMLLVDFAQRARSSWHASYRERITRAPVLMTVPALMFFVLPLLVLVMYLVFTPLMGTLGRL